MLDKVVFLRWMEVTRSRKPLHRIAAAKIGSPGETFINVLIRVGNLNSQNCTIYMIVKGASTPERTSTSQFFQFLLSTIFPLGQIQQNIFHPGWMGGHTTTVRVPYPTYSMVWQTADTQYTTSYGTLLETNNPSSKQKSHRSHIETRTDVNDSRFALLSNDV
eukprot:scaffold11442_cov177-Amphora_coffeaeformis.AAC.5